MKKAKALITLVALFLAPSLAIGVGGGETMYGSCPNIYRTDVDYYVKFSPKSILSGAKIVSLVPRYDFDKYFSNFYGFVGSSTKEVSFSLSGIIIRAPFAGDPVSNNSEFYMRFRVSTASQQAINPPIYGGACTLIVNWEVPIVLKNTPITGPAEITVGQTAEYNVSVPEAVDYWTLVSESFASVCEIVGDQDKSPVIIKGLSPGQCTIIRAAGIDDDPEVEPVVDKLSVEIVLSEEARRAATLLPAIQLILNDE